MAAAGTLIILTQQSFINIYTRAVVKRVKTFKKRAVN